jgi:hypothetical protein
VIYRAEEKYYTRLEFCMRWCIPFCTVFLGAATLMIGPRTRLAFKKIITYSS